MGGLASTVYPPSPIPLQEPTNLLAVSPCKSLMTILSLVLSPTILYSLCPTMGAAKLHDNSALLYQFLVGLMVYSIFLTDFALWYIPFVEAFSKLFFSGICKDIAIFVLAILPNFCSKQHRNELFLEVFLFT
jgi:hypothetical protein